MVAVLLALWPVSVLGQSFSFAAPPEAKPTVFVSILPQAYFIERIAGSDFDIEIMVGPGQSPETYEPTPKQMAKLSEASIYFRIGVPFEVQLISKIDKILPGLNIANSAEGISFRPIENHEHHNRNHDTAEELDPHIWLDPSLAEIISKNMLDGLISINPAQADKYRGNYDSLIADLDAVDAEIKKILAHLKGRSFYVFHPAFGYFGSAYGLKQVAVEIGGKEPGARQMAALIERANEEGVRIIFVQPQFSRKSAETLADAIGGAVVSIDPLGADLIANLKEMAHKLAAGLNPGFVNEKNR